MLVLSRKTEQTLILGNDIAVTVLAIEGDRVKLGIQAPRELTVMRQEIYEQVRAANAAAAQADTRDLARSLAAILRAGGDEGVTTQSELAGDEGGE